MDRNAGSHAPDESVSLLTNRARSLDTFIVGQVFVPPQTVSALREYLFWVVASVVALVVVAFVTWFCVRYIPNDKVGIVEKLWSAAGSLDKGAIVALQGEAGFQPTVLRGGLHFGLWRWQYSVHKRPLITIKQGKLGYVFSRAAKRWAPARPWAGWSSATISRMSGRIWPAGRRGGSGPFSAKACMPSTWPCST